MLKTQLVQGRFHMTLGSLEGRAAPDLMIHGPYSVLCVSETSICDVQKQDWCWLAVRILFSDSAFRFPVCPSGLLGSHCSIFALVIVSTCPALLCVWKWTCFFHPWHIILRLTSSSTSFPCFRLSFSLHLLFFLCLLCLTLTVLVSTWDFFSSSLS